MSPLSFYYLLTFILVKEIIIFSNSYRVKNFILPAQQRAE